MQLALNSSYVWHEVIDTFDATQGAQAFGIIDPLLLHDERGYRIWNAEARLDGEWGPADWLLGLARIEARQNVLTLLESATGPSTATIDEDRRLSAETAVFGSMQLPLGERFHLEAGARLFSGMVKDTRIIGGAEFTRDLHRTGLTPSLALSWQAKPNGILFVRYGSALRQGGVDIGASGELESFDSDELATLEAGWRSQLPHDGQLELGVFATRWHDMQSDILLPSGLVETTNVGNARIYGAEANWRQDFGSSWHTAVGGAFLNSRLLDDTLGLGSDDRRLPVVPTYTLRADIDRDLIFGSFVGGVGLHLNYIGPSRLSFDPVLDRKMGNFLTGEAAAHVDFGRWTLALAIANLFGGGGDTFALGNRLRIRSGNQYTPQRPTTANISLGFGF